MSETTLLVLAAGLGSRYGGFKQIDPIGPHGEIILDYSIYDAFRAGFDRAVLVITPALEQPMREHFAATLGAHAPIDFVFQRLDDVPAGFALPATRKKPWGTAHAIRAARAELGESFGVINADDFYGPSSYRVLRDFLVAQKSGDYAMVGFELEKTLSDHGTVSRGICREDADGFLIEIVEHTKVDRAPAGGVRTSIDGSARPIAPDSITSMNMWGFDVSLVSALEKQFETFLKSSAEDPKAEFFIPTVVDTLIKQKKSRCRVLRSSEAWFGMTYQEDRQQARATLAHLVERGTYPATGLRAALGVVAE